MPIDLSLHMYSYKHEPSPRSDKFPVSSGSNSASSPISATEPSNANYAFLVHSQSTIPNNLPPSVDNKPLCRQKRRRTCPEDQAILEAEFDRNPRPDKAARRSLVQRVALGEKEVQIWFQNRRQNNRRKSRPLFPHELQSPHLDPQMSLAKPVETLASFEEEENDFKQTAGMAEQDDFQQTGRVAQYLEESSSVEGAAEAVPETENDKVLDEMILSGGAPASSVQRATTSMPDEEDSGRVQTQYSLNAETVDVDAHDLLQLTALESSQLSNRPQTTPSKRRVRLSTTAEGLAKILMPDELSPSPPRAQPVQDHQPQLVMDSLGRNYSAAGFDDLRSSFGSTTGLPRVTSGRSKDSRAWEFWCDSEGRNELAMKADQEQTGSAAAAISIMRSNSRGHKVVSLPRDVFREVSRSSSTARVKRQKKDHLAKPRQSSSRSAPLSGRTQPVPKVTAKKLGGKGASNEPSSANASFILADSDKENIDPGGNLARDATPHSQVEKKRIGVPILGVSRKTNSQLTDRRGRGRKRGLEKELLMRDDGGMECDEEVEDFMRRQPSGTQGSGPAVEDDLDCIQGLLSLSQGAWK